MERNLNKQTILDSLLVSIRAGATLSDVLTKQSLMDWFYSERLTRADRAPLLAAQAEQEQMQSQYYETASPTETVTIQMPAEAKRNFHRHCIDLGKSVNERITELMNADVTV